MISNSKHSDTVLVCTVACIYVQYMYICLTCTTTNDALVENADIFRLIDRKSLVLSCSVAQSLYHKINQGNSQRAH